MRQGRRRRGAGALDDFVFHFFVATGAVERDRVDRASIPACLSGRFSDCVHRPSSTRRFFASGIAADQRADYGRPLATLATNGAVYGQDLVPEQRTPTVRVEETVRWRETARREGRVDRAEAVSRNGV